MPPHAAHIKRKTIQDSLDGLVFYTRLDAKKETADTRSAVHGHKQLLTFYTTNSTFTQTFILYFLTLILIYGYIFS
jgi:hypothetical protein